MRIGCFALVEPFSPMGQQFQVIREMGIEYADLIDNHNAGMPGANEVHLYESTVHTDNFIDCIKSRKKPISTIEAAVQSDLISHLSNAVVRLKRPIQWNPEKEQIVGDEEAAKKLNRAMRSPWSV